MEQEAKKHEIQGQASPIMMKLKNRLQIDALKGQIKRRVQQQVSINSVENVLIRITKAKKAVVIK